MLEEIFSYFLDIIDRFTPGFVKPDQLIKFLIAGFLGLIVDTGLLYIFVEFVGFSPRLSKLISTESAIIMIFFINESWTYKDHRPGTLLTRFLKSNGFRLVGLVVGVFTIQVFLDFGLHLVVANLLSIGLELIFNYTFETLVTWKAHKS